MAERVEEILSTGKAPNFHGLVVMRGGEIVLERYGAGPDHRLGDSLGHVDFDRDTLHDLRSVSKSVVALLYGIALGEGLVPEPGAPLVAQFPEYQDLVADPERAHLTVEHALTMTLGLEWDESAPYTSPANSEIAMELAPDRYRYLLERPVVEEAGKLWHYCGGATALLGGLIARGAGRPLEEYAATALLGPLGIDAFEWSKGYHDTVSAAAGLRLRPVDLAAVGQLVLDGGRGIVPGEWLQELVRSRVVIDEGFEYGYQWYVNTRGRHWVGGLGNGGQRLLVLPEEELVVALTAGDYDQSEDGSAAVLEAVLAS
ncbi:serine hydrolase domain-containing protein [Nonomuraea angiospora]|uniref:serine hydrolase domain-containing protein n=1 Tax=Nonomuraea angiospora TaxID=46172 RepID=UPI0029BB90D4|nr:serine hydrolase [Nonomuraea angiospora]MDX3109431.1 serine hydrolase [Nonomuraea angiospora]